MSITPQLPKKYAQAKKYIKEELPVIEMNIFSQFENIFLKDPNGETYYRELWKLYEYKYIKNYLKELIYFYKTTEHPDITEEDKKRIKNFLTLWNLGIILKVIESIIPYTEREGKDIWDYIAEGMQSLIEGIEKFEVGYTDEKMTKDTKIKLLGINSEEYLEVELESNKPFADIDIEVKNNTTKEEETINVKLEWQLNNNNIYTTKTVLDSLSNSYSEEDIIKLKVSKKVWEPSTFLTNKIFYALKKYLNKQEPLKISNNYFILSKQVNKLTHKYTEQFDKEPSPRWIAYYLTIQNNNLREMPLELYDLYIKKKKKEKLSVAEKNKLKILGDIFCIVRVEEDKVLYLESNQNSRRALMIKNKETKEKNKVTYGDYSEDFQGDEDELVYDDSFEYHLDKKEKEIIKIKQLYTGVVSLDQEIREGEDTSISAFLWEEKELSNLIAKLDSEYEKREFFHKMKIVLTPKELFYFELYFFQKMSLEEITDKVYSLNKSISGLRDTLKKATAKILFYIKYKL